MSSSTLTSWRAPWPRVWTSEAGDYAVSVIPGKVINGKLDRTQLQLFTFADDGRQLQLWHTTLNYYPNQVLISPDARVVLLNEYPGDSDQRAVTVLSDTGRILAQYGISALMPKDEFDAIPGDEKLAPKKWADFAIFSSVKNLTSPPAVAEQPVERTVGELKTIHNEWPYVLQLHTVTGRTLWFDLLNGKMFDGGKKSAG